MHSWCHRLCAFRPIMYGRGFRGSSRPYGGGGGYRGRGRGRFRNHEGRGPEDGDAACHKRSRDGSADGGRGRPPPHLRGRDIGLWYRDRQMKKGPDKTVMASVSMDSQQAHSLGRLLDSIGSSSDSGSKGAYEGHGAEGNTRAHYGRNRGGGRGGPLNLKGKEIGTGGKNWSRGPYDDHSSNADQWVSRKQDEQPAEAAASATTYTRTIESMRDSAFKRAYMDNVRANQLMDEIKPESSGGISRCSEQDGGLRDDLLQLQNTAKYQKMLEFRQRLPSYAMQEEILHLIHNNQVVVLSGETGCGKTTQVPQFILEDEILGGRGSGCHVVCTQPRRISAISVAQRVADERGETLGRSVGYQIRLEAAKARSRGSIMYCTTGIVLQWLQGDPLLQSVSHLVLDEIHERDMQSDFLITIAKDLLPKRPDLKLILMSATLNAEKFSEYYGGCPMVHIPGFTFPVIEYYLEDVLDMMRFEFPEPKGRGPFGMPKRNKSRPADELFDNVIVPWVNDQENRSAISRDAAREMRKPHSEELTPELVVCLLRNICQQPPGAVLIFLPGWSDISTVNKLIEEDSMLRRERLLVIPLHSLMPTANQREVFDRPPNGVRKVVLATNIAETSITIDDIVYVIDCGYIKMTNFDKTSNLATLSSEWVTMANARQRRGRAGRVQEGICYHLFSRIREEHLAEYPLPEILRTRLEEIVLQVKILKLGKVQPFLLKLMQAPDQEVVALSVKLLEAINALDEEENLTPLGFHLARLPIDPLTGRMLLMSSIFSCVDPILTVAAVLSFKEPFVVPLGKEKLVDEVKARFAGNTFSDHLMYVKVFDAWRDATSSHNTSFCYKNFLSPSVLQQIKRMRGQFFGLLKDHKFVAPEVKDGSDIEVNNNSGNVAVVRAIIASGLYPNVACLKRINSQNSRRPSIMRTADHNRVIFHPKCVNDKARVFESPWMVFREKLKMSNVFLFDATNVPNYPLLLFGQHLIYVASEGAIHVDDFVKIRCSAQVADVIRKLRKELDSLLEYKISHPDVIQSSEHKLLDAIVDLLSSEKVDPHQQSNARWDDNEEEGDEEFPEDYSSVHGKYSFPPV